MLSCGVTSVALLRPLREACFEILVADEVWRSRAVGEGDAAVCLPGFWRSHGVLVVADDDVAVVKCGARDDLEIVENLLLADVTAELSVFLVELVGHARNLRRDGDDAVRRDLIIGGGQDRAQASCAVGCLAS